MHIQIVVGITIVLAHIWLLMQEFKECDGGFVEWWHNTNSHLLISFSIVLAHTWLLIFEFQGA